MHMRILNVTQAYDPFLERGGQAGTVRELTLGMAARGHHVTVLTADLGGGRRADLGSGCPWGSRSLAPNREIIYLRTAISFRALTFNPALSSFCRQRLAEFDVVHIFGLYDLLGPAVARFSSRKGIPYLVEPMGMFHPIDRAFFLKSVWHRLLGRPLIRNAWRMIATAELERKELIQAGISPDRILLRFNPVDSAEYQKLPPRGNFRNRWRIAPHQPVVLFLGRLIPRKGADLLIEAFAKALPGDGVLVVAGLEGDSGYLKRLRAVAARCGVSERVRFTGPLYGEEKKAALADADLFVLPSSYENFANAAAEAVASGVPVVITDRCGIHSLIQDRAGLVVPRDRDAVADAIRTLVENRALRESFRAGCSAVTQELSVDRVASILEGFYRESPGHRAPNRSQPSDAETRSSSPG
jgi:glycosyltransferase involved in cell wall biosynthesis